MSNEYGLDLAFSSATIAAVADTSMVAAFGFCSGLVGGAWSQDGQKAEKVTAGGSFYFAVFDTAPTPGTAVEINIAFGAIGSATPFVNEKGEEILSPIVADANSGLTYKGATEGSVGCNVQGAKWLAGPYTLQSTSGSYECTVTVLAEDSSKNHVEFSVDPEVVVEGGNPKPNGVSGYK